MHGALKPRAPVRTADEEFHVAYRRGADAVIVGARLAATAADARAAVDAAIERYGTDRIGVVIGTSTSGIAEGESALRHHAITGRMPESFHYGQQELGSPAAMLAATLGIGGPAYVHSSACASSAKALASAARLIRMGVCDAVRAGWIRYALSPSPDSKRLNRSVKHDATRSAGTVTASISARGLRCF